MLKKTTEVDDHRKILIISNLYPPITRGGAEISTQVIARGLADLGHSVRVFTLKPSGRPSTANDSGVVVTRYPIQMPYWPFDGKAQHGLLKLWFHIADNLNVPAFFQLVRLLRSFRPDFASTQGITGVSGLAWLALKLFKVPTTHSARDYHLLCPRSSMFRDGRPCAKQCGDCRLVTFPRRKLVGLTGGLIFNSDFVRDAHLDHGIGQGKVTMVIPPALSKATAAPARAPSSGFIFGFIGRLSPEKGVQNLLKAFAANKNADWRCLIAGVGDDAFVDALRAMADPRVTFLGWTEPEDFLSLIDTLVVPSLWNEPAGRVVVEAYAHGVPVVAASRGGITENVEEGLTGWLYEAESIEALSKALAISTEIKSRERLDPVLMKTKVSAWAGALAIKNYLEINDAVRETDVYR